MNVDVAIIGGGPAGSTVGTLLKKYSPFLDVLILERERFPRDHVGESQLPAVSQILQEMGAWDKVEAENFPVKVGATYRWGATDELWSLNFLNDREFVDEPRPAQYVGQRTQTAFQVDRSIYDKVLLDHAAAVGCEVLQPVPVAKVDRHGDRINALVLPDGRRVEARWYVDCSGEAGIVRRAMDVEVEEPTLLRNVAFWDYWQDASWAVTIGNGGTQVQIMSLGWGWLWFIPITPTRTSVGLVLPAAHYKKTGKSKEQLYAEAIASEPLISMLLANARQEGNVQGTKDWSFLARRLAGENWFLAGDCCGFADPILSAGLTLAQTGARKVAYSILEMDRGNLEPEWIRGAYNDDQRRQIRHHMQFADYWYSANGCFTDLKALCSDIAKSAGLELDADSAFRWLSTGGFALDVPGFAGAAAFGIHAIKRFSEHLGGKPASWEMSRTNHWRLKWATATEEVFPYFCGGKIVPVKSWRRGYKILPIIGVFEYVVTALKRTSDGVEILEECVNALIRCEGSEPNYAVVLATEALEAMFAEGWIEGEPNPDRPFITVADRAAMR